MTARPDSYGAAKATDLLTSVLCDRQSADMVILGSEKLGSQHPMGSVSLSALKALKLPVLLVKADASGDVIKEEVDRKTRSDRR